MVDIRTQTRKHAAEIRAFRRSLFSHGSDSSAWVRSGDTSLMPELRRLGPIRSVTDRHAELTIVGDTTDQTAMFDDPTADGVVLTLSVAAHHRMLHSRLLVDADEAASWIAEILGDEWAGHAYSAGALSTTADSKEQRPRLTTQFFYVYIGSDCSPQEAPEKVSVPLTPLKVA